MGRAIDQFITTKQAAGLATIATSLIAWDGPIGLSWIYC